MWCGIALGVVAAYGLAVLPLRPVLLGGAPQVLAAVTGSRLGLVAVGVEAAAEDGPWLWPLLAGIVSIVKFHWVFWWAGRLWGEPVLARIAGDGRRAQRSVRRAEALVRRHDLLALAVTYVPLPIPRDVVHAALGVAGVPLRRYVVADVACAALTQSLFVLAGYTLGESAVPVLREYATWGGLISLVVLAGMGLAWWRGRATKGAAPTR